MRSLFFRIRRNLTELDYIPLLLIRLVLAYGFYTPAMAKWSDIHAIGEWFAGMHIPAPMLSAYLAACTEVAGIILLTLGLGVRFISLPLMFTMLIAIRFVHWNNGFDASDNGFEIPLYYFLMLMLLFFRGAGKFSIDYLLGIALQKSENEE